MNRELLEKPFSPDQIKQRDGLYGDVLDYVEGSAVIQRLNEAFNAEWAFEILDHHIYEKEVVVLGKLTAQGIAKSSCTCPAPGICRHRLAAIVHLRSAAPAGQPA